MAGFSLLGGNPSTTATSNTQPTAANYAPALGGFIRGNGAESVGGPSIVLTNVHTGAANAKATAGAAGGKVKGGKAGKVVANTAPVGADSSVNITTYSQNLDPSVVNSALAFAENFGAQATALSALAIQQAGSQAQNTQLISAGAIQAAQQQSASIAQAATTDPRNVTTLNASGPTAAAATTTTSIEKIGLVVTVIWFLYVVSQGD